MSPRNDDERIKSQAFQARIAEADAYSQPHGLDRWSVRILWACLSEGPKIGRRYAMRRGKYRESAAWDRYSRLVKNGWLSEDPPGFCYDPEEKPEWEEYPLAWFNHISMDITPESTR